MSLSIITVHGVVQLGSPPPSRIPCSFCGTAAQVVAEGGASGPVAACAPCAVDALIVAAELADTPGGRE